MRRYATHRTNSAPLHLRDGGSTVGRLRDTQGKRRQLRFRRDGRTWDSPHPGKGLPDVSEFAGPCRLVDQNEYAKLRALFGIGSRQAASRQTVAVKLPLWIPGVFGMDTGTSKLAWNGLLAGKAMVVLATKPRP